MLYHSYFPLFYLRHVGFLKFFRLSTIFHMDFINDHNMDTKVKCCYIRLFYSMPIFIVDLLRFFCFGRLFLKN
jgi:hypothetical protein